MGQWRGCGGEGVSGEGGRRGRGEGGEGVGSEGGMSEGAAGYCCGGGGGAQRRGEAPWRGGGGGGPSVARRCVPAREHAHTAHQLARVRREWLRFEPSRAPLLKEEVVAHKQLPAGPPRHVGSAGNE